MNEGSFARCSRRRTRVVLVAFAAFLAVACAPGVRPYAADDEPDMGVGEGLLILHIDSDVPVAALVLDSGAVAQSLQQGEHVWLVRAEAGTHRWRRVRFAAQAGVAQTVHLEGEEFQFEVEAGRLNYAGALVIRSSRETRSVGRVDVRHRNHAAMAIRQLRERHAELIAELPLHHGGHGGDRFFEYFERMRAGIDSPPTATE